MRTAKHRVADEIARRYAEIVESRANCGFQSRFGVIEREFDFA